MGILYVHRQVMSCRRTVDRHSQDREQAQKRPLICIAGFIHDVSDFIDEHPGGSHLLVKNIGKDATTAFFGGVYDHSNAAHNVRSFRVSVSMCVWN
jgi:cytochrome b involved in lipid metabolism